MSQARRMARGFDAGIFRRTFGGGLHCKELGKEGRESHRLSRLIWTRPTWLPAPVLEIAAKDSKQKAFVDLQADVTADDLRQAVQEGFAASEHAKRYTTWGMATDQGRTSNLPGLAVLAKAQGISIPEAGLTKFRPPASGVAIGAIAAERFGDLRPYRLTPMHDWHLKNGATMYAAGLWERPMIYGKPGETVEQAYVREATAVRQSVGIADVSTLGQNRHSRPGRRGVPRPRSTPTCSRTCPSTKPATD